MQPRCRPAPMIRAGVHPHRSAKDRFPADRAAPCVRHSRDNRWSPAPCRYRTPRHSATHRRERESAPPGTGHRSLQSADAHRRHWRHGTHRQVRYSGSDGHECRRGSPPPTACRSPHRRPGRSRMQSHPFSAAYEAAGSRHCAPAPSTKYASPQAEDRAEPH